MPCTNHSAQSNERKENKVNGNGGDQMTTMYLSAWKIIGGVLKDLLLMI